VVQDAGRCRTRTRLSSTAAELAPTVDTRHDSKFLSGGASGLAPLRHAADEDPAPGLRERAPWAYSFAGATDTIAVLERAAARDPSARVRGEARALLGAGHGQWRRA
jgi:hypothetical protein